MRNTCLWPNEVYMARSELFAKLYLGFHLVLLLGCGTSGNTEGVSSSPAASITADPNPVPGVAKFETTTISWDTGDGSSGYIYLIDKGQPPKEFITKRPSGSQPFKWVGKGTYEFQLYSGDRQQGGRQLASVQVARSQQ